MEEQKYTEDRELVPIQMGKEEEPEDSQQLINIIINLASGGTIETSRWYPDYVFGREKEVMNEIIANTLDKNTNVMDRFVKIDNITVRADQVVGIKTVSMISSDNGWQEDIPVAELVEEEEK